MNNYLFWKRFAQGKLKTHVSSVKIRIPSPKEILSWSERRLPNSTLVGKIDNAHTVEHDTLRPVSGGLFCERIFGPIATNVCACLRRKGWNEDYCKVCEVQFTKSRLRRYQMGHILLAAPVIHIWALQGGYLANLLGKKNFGIRSIAYGKLMCQSKLCLQAFYPKESTSTSEFSTIESKIQSQLPWRYTRNGRSSPRPRVSTETRTSMYASRRYDASHRPTSRLRSYKADKIFSRAEQGIQKILRRKPSFYTQKNVPINLRYFFSEAADRAATGRLKSLSNKSWLYPRHQGAKLLSTTATWMARSARIRRSAPHVKEAKIQHTAFHGKRFQVSINTLKSIKNYKVFHKKEIQKVYERGNVLPFHQFLLYKPDTFNKIIQFFNSLNKEEKNFPLPHYSKQKSIFYSTTRSVSLQPTLEGASSALPSKEFTVGRQGSLNLVQLRVPKAPVVPVHVRRVPSAHVVLIPCIIGSFITQKIQKQAKSDMNQKPYALKINRDKQIYKSKALTYKIIRSRTKIKDSTRSVANYPKNRSINFLRIASFKKQPTLAKRRFHDPSTVKRNRIYHEGCNSLIFRSSPVQRYLYVSAFYALNSALKIHNKVLGVFTFLYDLQNHKNKGHLRRQREAYVIEAFKKQSKQSKVVIKRKINLIQSNQRNTIRDFGVFNQSDILNWGISYDTAFIPILYCLSSKKESHKAAFRASATTTTSGRALRRQSVRASSSKLLGWQSIQKNENKSWFLSHTQRASLITHDDATSLGPTWTAQNYMDDLRSYPSTRHSSQRIPNLTNLRDRLKRRKPLLTDVKNVAYTGSSVLFQSLKNFNLLLLDSLISWKWKRSKTQLNSFLLQNKLTKKKRNLRNKLAKIKIILTKRKNLVQSFLNTKQLPEWMIISILPILPPALRPILELEPNNVVVSDLNVLYQTVIRRNDALMGLLSFRALEIDILNRQVSLQQAIEKLFDKGAGTKKRPVKSLSQGFHGKKGLFRSHLLGKRVDYSGRSVIVVGPQLKLHECGLPKEMALVLFLPFLIARLKKHKVANNTSQAKQLILHKDKQIWSHLKSLIYEHPVLLNRAPTLHRLGFQAFQPILVSGKAMILPALVCTGFNADFDGDQMAVHVPLSHAARAESWKLLHAKNNMLSPATGKPIIVLSQEMILGCYCSSLILNRTHFMTYAFNAGYEIFNEFDVKNLQRATTQSVTATSDRSATLRVSEGSSSRRASIESRTSMYASHHLRNRKANKVFPRARPADQPQAISMNLQRSYESLIQTPQGATAIRKWKKVHIKTTHSSDLKDHRKFIENKLQNKDLSLVNQGKSLYFTSFQEIYKALSENRIAIQTAVWLRVPFFEDNQFLEEPLEIRLDAMGHFFRSYCQSQRHFSKNIKSQNQMKGISYIRTSAGRVQLNDTFYSSWS